MLDLTAMTATTDSEAHRRSRWREVAKWLAVAALLVVVRQLTHRGLATGAAPALSGRDLDGRSRALEAPMRGPVVVHFWATWCEVCAVELPAIDALARDHAVLSVATSSGQAAAIRDAMQRRGVAFPVIVDEDGAIASAWGVHAFPTSFVVDARREIRFVETGYTTGVGLRARLWWAK